MAILLSRSFTAGSSLLESGAALILSAVSNMGSRGFSIHCRSLSQVIDKTAVPGE